MHIVRSQSAERRLDASAAIIGRIFLIALITNTRDITNYDAESARRGERSVNSRCSRNDPLSE